ncbi:MAG TPA: hypothetical protein VK899_03080 [Gemmatimonadales bacterium]|nr:hypothetical protein [Gemmatimonadales bacterium]
MRALRERLRISVEARSLPQIEVADATRKADLFRQAFGTEVELVWHPLGSRSRMNDGPRGPRLLVVGTG